MRVTRIIQVPDKEAARLDANDPAWSGERPVGKIEAHDQTGKKVEMPLFPQTRLDAELANPNSPVARYVSKVLPQLQALRCPRHGICSNAKVYFDQVRPGQYVPGVKTCCRKLRKKSVAVLDKEQHILLQPPGPPQTLP